MMATIGTVPIAVTNKDNGEQSEIIIWRDSCELDLMQNIIKYKLTERQ